MPYVQSGTLRDLMGSRPQPLPRIRKVIEQVGEALQYAHTILESSVDRLKTGVWLGLLFTVGFSLVWMPWNFDQLHLGLRDRVSAFALTAASTAEAADLIALQGYLEDHDLRWVMLSILTGYGNMVSLAAAASAVVLWRVYFGAAPIRTLLRIFLPRYAIGWASGL